MWIKGQAIVVTVELVRVHEMFPAPEPVLDTSAVVIGAVIVENIVLVAIVAKVPV